MHRIFLKFLLISLHFHKELPCCFHPVFKIGFNVIIQIYVSGLWCTLVSWSLSAGPSLHRRRVACTVCSLTKNGFTDVPRARRSGSTRVTQKSNKAFPTIAESCRTSERHRTPKKYTLLFFSDTCHGTPHNVCDKTEQRDHPKLFWIVYLKDSGAKVCIIIWRCSCEPLRELFSAALGMANNSLSRCFAMLSFWHPTFIFVWKFSPSFFYGDFLGFHKC